jgi:hypothetical protein
MPAGLVLTLGVGKRFGVVEAIVEPDIQMTGLVA